MGLVGSNFDFIARYIETSSYKDMENMLKNGSVTKQELEKICSEPNQEDSHKRTLLHHAVWAEDSRAVQLLLDYTDNLNLEVVDAFGMTPLAASINRGNIEAAKCLLQHKASINGDKHNGYYLLRTAVYQNRLDMVELLMKYNCQTTDHNTDVQSGSLLHVACDSGNLKLVKLLVEVGKIPINISDKFLIQPVHVAAWKNYLDMMRYLHEKGADLNAEDSLGNVPLGWAIFHDSHDLIRFLRANFAVEKPFKINDQAMVFRQRGNSKKYMNNNNNNNNNNHNLNEPMSIDKKAVQIEMTKIESAINNDKPNGVVNLSYQ